MLQVKGERSLLCQAIPRLQLLDNVVSSTQALFCIFDGGPILTQSHGRLKSMRTAKNQHLDSLCLLHAEPLPVPLIGFIFAGVLMSVRILPYCRTLDYGKTSKLSWGSFCKGVRSPPPMRKTWRFQNLFYDRQSRSKCGVSGNSSVLVMATLWS
jgi:hypothetical protein